MKKITLGISTLAISTLMLGVSSCKKKDNNNNVVCKITSAVATPTGGTPSSIVLALGAVADFGAQNCQYTTKVDAR